MDIPVKKLKSGFELPVLGLGTWRMGGLVEHDLQNDDAKDIASIRAAINAGVTHIDTAEKYADGYAEKLVGQAIVGYERSRLFLASKVRTENFAYDDVLRACEASLKRLNTNYLDLYLLHFYTEAVPLKDTVRAVDRLVDEKLVRNIGVCNFGKERLAEAQRYSTHKIVYDQVHYSLEFREPERKGLLEYCQQNDILLSAWRPLARGKYGKDMMLESVPAVVAELAKKYNKTPVQIAINWLVSQSNVVTISTMRRKEHLADNLGALGWGMEAGDIERLRQEFPDQKEVSDSVPLAVL